MIAVKQIIEMKIMQIQLPFFPLSVRYFNEQAGVFEKDNFVYYMHNGSPLFCHDKEDRKSYRYITANLVQINLCTPSEIARIFGVSIRSIQLNAKALREKGPEWFFNRQETRGEAYKFTEEIAEETQKLLDEGVSKRQISRKLGISDSAIRYHLKKGKLKKNRSNQKPKQTKQSKAAHQAEI